MKDLNAPAVRRNSVEYLKEFKNYILNSECHTIEDGLYDTYLCHAIDKRIQQLNTVTE